MRFYQGLLATLCFAAVSASPLIAQSAPSPPAIALLDKLIGTWTMTGTFRGHTISYDLEARRVLNGRFIELHMTDVARPPQYEARVFIGEDTVANHVIVHWLDSFGGAYSIPYGTGTVFGDTLLFHVPYPDGDFRDTFVFHRQDQSWTFRLESSDGHGGWKLFVEYAVRPALKSSSSGRLSFATQLVVVTTTGWDSTVGELRRFSRDHPYSSWRQEGRAVPIVVGKTGLAWGVGFDSSAVTGEPHKHEGDGKSPAGIFPIDTAFGFAPADSMRAIRLPYVALTSNTECVDDTASVHYNTVVDRSTVPSVDWQSSEKMRKVGQYRLGAIIGYNANPPVKARGSCIFFHIWNGPRSTTVGCTALDALELARLLEWLDRKSQPVVVQVPASVYPRLRNTLGLPLLDR
jgi:L,D-peptidoglycan transpeptidase YkuD (ErfK/YbiS/YcfS/YnhG family)